MGDLLDKSPLARFIAIMLVVWCINYMAYHLLGRPWIYCNFVPILRPLYFDVALMALWLVAAFTVLMLFRGRYSPAFGGAVVFLGIVQLPNLAEQAFRLGGTCG